MIIERIRLKNIKTYTDTEILLHSGVNFIKGKNGAGKSTLIECIGYTLFNYADGRNVNEDFLTYGKSDGLIEIDFIGIEKKKYSVIRTVSVKQNKRSWLIYERNYDTPLDLYFEEDKQAFLAEVMGLGREKDPSWIFRDIIGVRQGSFREPFEKPQEERKKYFNRIFGVEDYTRAFDQLLNVSHLISHRTDLANKDMDYLTQSAAGLEEKKREEEIQAAAFKQTEKEIKQTGLKLLECERQWEAQKQLKVQKIGVEKQLLGTDHNMNNLKAQLADKLVQKEVSILAKDKLKNHEKGFYQYETLKNTLVELDNKAVLKKELQLSLASVEGEISKLDAQINTEQKNLEINEANDANEKTQLKEAIQKLQNELERLTPLLKDIERIDLAMDDLNKNISKADVYIQKGKEFIDKKLNIKISQLEQLKEEWNKNHAEADKLSVLLEKEQMLSEAKIEKEKLQHQRTALNEKLHTFEQYENELQHGICPFFNSECTEAKNKGGDGIAASRQDVVLNLEKNTLGLLAAEKKIEQLRQYEGTQVKYIAACERLENRQNEVLACELDIKDLASTPSSWDIAEKASALIKEFGSIISQMTPENNISVQFAEYLQQLQLSTLNAAHAYIRVFNSFSLLIKTLKERADIFMMQKKAESGSINTEMAAVNAQIQSAINRLKSLEAQESSFSSMRTFISQLGLKKEEMLKERKRIEIALKAYENLEIMIDKKKKEAASKEIDYKIYIQNKAEAQKLDNILKVIEEITIAVSNENLLLINLKEKLLDFEAAYDEKVENELQNAVVFLNHNKGQLESKIHHYKDEKMRIEKEITHKLAAQKKLEEQKAKHERLIEAAQIIKNMRAAMKTAGPRIASIFRNRIQSRADSIYRSVSREGVGLSWSESYEIELHDMWQGQKRKRNFKQLSGGEKMTAALSIRLSLLEEFSSAKIGFFDEPTDNMDISRKEQLTEILTTLCASYHQVFVISHDDAFDKLTENVICLAHGTEGTAVIS
jgi:exonuclease SbcC